MSDTKYRRILLKLSGEALGEGVSENVAVGLDFSKIHAVCEVIRQCHDLGVQIGLVIGGGNFWRGVKNGSGKMQRSHGDAMGMLATVMNAIAVADVLEQHGLDARVLSAVEMNKFTEYFTRDRADRYLNEGKVVIFAAGAVRYSHLTYDKVLADHLKATDSTAMTLAMDNHMPMVCFALNPPENILRVVRGEEIGTTVTI